jgi:hypothetical protein
VEETGVWRRAGARSAAEHLAKLGGTSTSVARRTLETSKHVAGLPAITDALQGGVLSTAQADAIVAAAAADPSAEARLLLLAQTTNVTELREECLRVRAAADPDPDATHRRIHAHRCQRTFADAEGAWNLHARGTPEQGARLETALEPIIDEMYAKARQDGRREPREAYAFDALIGLAERDTTSAKKPKPAVSRDLARGCHCARSG